MNTVKTKKLKLEDISLSILSKRNRKFDNEFFPFKDLKLSPYDIRESRDSEKMAQDLERDGQFQAITVNFETINTKDATIINGKTRYEGMEINNLKGVCKFDYVEIEAYVGLTQMEQDYLNAQINVSQKTLSANEKLGFVDKYQDRLNGVELGEVLGLSPSQVEKYKATSKLSKDVREKFIQVKEGYGRGDINIETAADCVMSYETESGGQTPNNETLKELGDTFNSMKMNRDTKRKLVKKVSKQTAKLQNDSRITSNYSTKEIVKIAERESIFNNNTGGSGDKLPKNSSKKYKIIDEILSTNKYEFAILLFAESLYRKDDKGNDVESETKRIIDKVPTALITGNETIKLKDIEDYGIENKKNIIIKNDDVMAVCKMLRPSTRKGIIYVNGAGLYSQRPEFMNFLKKLYPNSTVVMVTLDLLFGKSQIKTQSDRDREIITVFSGAKNFKEVISFYESKITGLKVKKYATTPQEKYILYV